MCILYTASICIDDLVVLGLQTRQVFTAEQINEATYVDIHGSKALFDSLRNNSKVKLDGRHFSYKVNDLNIVLFTIYLNEHIDE